MIFLGASCAALQLLGPIPSAARGAWLSMRSLVDMGVSLILNRPLYQPAGSIYLLKASISALGTTCRTLTSFNPLLPTATALSYSPLSVLIYDATASLIMDCVTVLIFFIPGMIAGPMPPPALTTTGLADDVATAPFACFCPAASWFTALVRLASVLSSFVS